MTRAVLIAALTAILAPCLTGCSPGGEPDRESARKGGSVSVALPVAPDSLDPAVAAGPEALRALWLVHTAPLTFVHADGAEGLALRPGLAEEMPEVSDDERELRFRLRRGLRYSDGSPVRVADFERAVKRALVLNPEGRDLFGGIEGARAYARSPKVGARISGLTANPRTREVRIRLVAPDPSFAQVLALPISAPVPAGTPARDRSQSPPPGIGSYRLGDPRPGRAFTLARERLPEDLPDVPAGNADEIVGQVVTDPALAARAAIDGGIDVSEGEPPLTMLPEVRSKYKDRYVESPTLAVDSVRLDTSRAPFDERDLRRAVGLALDETALTRLRNGFLVPTCNVVAPQVPGYREADPCPLGDPGPSPDLVRAQELASDALPTSGPLLVTADGLRHSRALERYMVQTLRKIGLSARAARTSDERADASVVLGREQPELPRPDRYFGPIDQRILAGRVALLELDGDPSESVDEWAALDRAAVEGALILPYGVETDGVLLSERLDATNCRRYHPLFGLDWSSLCLR